MPGIKRSIFIVIVLLLILTASFSCGGATLPADYESTKSDLAAAQATVTTLQGELAAAQAAGVQTGDAASELAQMQGARDAAVQELESLKAGQAALSAELEGLRTQNQANLSEIAALEAQLQQASAPAEEPPPETTPEITEVGVEQTLLALINQERQASGLNELIPGTNINVWAKQNSQNMAAAKRTLEFTDSLVPFQAAFIAGGYSTVEMIADGAMLVWQSDALEYTNNFLDAAAVYGSVEVVKAGDICYITFLASNFP
ncbi:hypothetical protein ACFLW1_01745 [Chloroflexota bacterium]